MIGGLHRWLIGKQSTCQARDGGSTLGSGRSPGEGKSNPLQYPCLDSPMDREVWQVTVHSIAQTWLKWACVHAHGFLLSVILGSPFQMCYCWSLPPHALYRGPYKATVPRQKVQGPSLTFNGLRYLPVITWNNISWAYWKQAQRFCVLLGFIISMSQKGAC